MKGLIISTALAAAAATTTAACDGGWPEDDDDVSVSSQAFQNWLGFVDCGPTQRARLTRAANILSDRIYRNGGAELRACLADAYLSNVDQGASSDEIWFQLTTPGQTIIQCTDSLRNDCGGSLDWWGCAGVGIGGERISIANSYLLDADYGSNPAAWDAQLAGIIGHELAHNRGHRHDGLGADEYALTVPSQVAACVERGEPNGARRSSLPWEAELAPAGRTGGTPFTRTCGGSALASGLVIGHGHHVESLRVICNDGTQSLTVGTTSPSSLSVQRCGAGQVLVGVRGRSTAVVESLGAICAPASNPAARASFTAVGDDQGVAFERTCPAGMAVRRVSGRWGSLIDQVQLECHAIGSSYSEPPQAADDWAGGDGGSLFLSRCAGKTAVRSLLGRFEARLDRLSARCEPILGNPAPAHVLPFVGGNGATTMFAAGCSASERMVGVRVRSGTVIDAVRPICADVTDWIAGTADLRLLPRYYGGDGGTTTDLRCPAREFVTGMNLRAGNVIDGMRIICRRLD